MKLIQRISVLHLHFPRKLSSAKKKGGPCTITACTVVHAVTKASSQSNRNGQNSTIFGPETPWTDFMKLGIYDHTCKSMWRCDNVGGLGEDVTCHMFWFGFRQLLFFYLYFWDRSQPTAVGGCWLTVVFMTCSAMQRDDV